ncbi:MAG: 6,7-dimethyl-8-ribityllumazine synthase [Bacteroidetes bacterium CG02_land_8_20_14_3_00_31_25]|nr:6,7-dimethyl-8-ribityllumazine synthase [Bacteroidota bacterium]PIV57812.1 MAG: 6,7-dimethyl-8-ribityllumazine synthase [Bacteroidetes bacterium CG02_land_8_20_14_3_00_31_25]
MSINLKSNKNDNTIPNAENMKFGIVVAEWNSKITDALLDAAIDTLKKCNVKEENIIVRYVPGCIELTAASKFMAELTDVDSVICIGCVIQGETKHFDYVCLSVVEGITELNIKYNIPFIFCVLTTANYQQAIERAGGNMGNKGTESALTAVKMVELKRSFTNQT